MFGAGELLDVGNSGCYERASRAPSDRGLTDDWLMETIKDDGGSAKARRRQIGGS